MALTPAAPQVTAMTDPMIQVSVIWLPTDWEQPPVDGGQNVFSLTGQGEAPLHQASFTVSSDMPVEQFLQDHLKESAQTRLASRSHGVSVWGRRIKADQRLCADDRIELLGPISADP